MNLGLIWKMQIRFRDNPYRLVNKFNFYMLLLIDLCLAISKAQNKKTKISN